MKLNLDEVFESFTMTKACTVSADEESKKAGIHKTVHLTVRFTGVTLRAVFAKVVGKIVIDWQAAARRKYESVEDGSTVVVDFRAPGKMPASPKEVTGNYKAYLATLSKEEREQAIADLM